MTSNTAESHEHRAAPRDEVHRRVPGLDLATGAPLGLTVVNLSPQGMMARCEGALATGDRLRVTLPTVGFRVATVRWALGGRIGCEFDQPIAAGGYPAALAAMR